MEEGALGYHFSLGYARLPNDSRRLPRVQLAARLFPGQTHLATAFVVLDTGAEVSVLDGTIALQAGWTTVDVVERASAVVPIYGLGSGSPILGYRHEITGYVGGHARFAQMKLHVLITLPNVLAFSVLGRSDFFEQVDVTFSERDARLYFRFRDPTILQS